MKLRIQDWLLIVAALFWIIFAGPFLISARDWLLVFIGFASLAGLVFWTVKAVRYHVGVKNNA